jgi:5-methylcytosine-specific restriction endonuclease McrA
MRPTLRRDVLLRDGHRCVSCGDGALDGARLEVDHILPVAAGGRDELDNLQVLCKSCNSGKSDDDRFGV